MKPPSDRPSFGSLFRPLFAPGSRSEQLAVGITLAAFVVATIYQIILVGDFRVDDAYITFSFSKNLASRQGPVYSHDLRVEGYSNFLWMVLTAAGLWVTHNADPYLVARCFGVGALLATVFVVHRATARSAGFWPALLAAGFVLCCTDLFRAALSGLETAAFVAAFVASWHVYLSERWPRWRWTTFALAPLALMRIDGFVPVFVLVVFEFFKSLAERRFTYGRFLRWVAPILLIWGLYFAWRWHYYGLPLPTTYYAKSMAAAHEPDRGYHMFAWFHRDYGLLALIPLVLCALVWGPRWDAFALVVAIALQIAYTIHVGGDWMPFHRFFLPTVPCLAILVSWGLHRLWCRTRRVHSLLRWPIRGAAFVCIAFTAVRMHAGSVDSVEEREKLAGAVQTTTHTRKNLLRSADLMRLVLRRPGERLATDYAGVFAVKTDAEIIDMWGLCNADIALRGNAEGINPEYGKSCPACFAQLQPDYFHVIVPIVRSVDAFHGIEEVIDAIFQGRAIDNVIDLRRNYAVGRVVEARSGRTLWFLERKRAHLPRQRRDVAPFVYVDYPFE